MTIKQTPHQGDVILSALVGDNSDLFPKVLAIYARDGDRILDATWGKGVFWKQVDTSRYNLVRNDLYLDADTRHDYGSLPFSDNSFDMFVLDPPYMHAGGYKSIKRSINQCYRNDTSGSTRSDVVASYHKGIKEASRLLVDGGVLVLKGADEIASGKQELFLPAFANTPDFIVEDVFVLVRKSRPCIRWPYQYHARKNHSYFLILRRKKKGKYEAMGVLQQ